MCGRNQRGRPKFDVVALETVVRGNNDWWHWMFHSIWHVAGDANILVRHLIERVGLWHICLKLITKQNASFVTKYSNKILKQKDEANCKRISFRPLRPKELSVMLLVGIQQMRHIHTYTTIPNTIHTSESTEPKYQNTKCQSTSLRHGQTGRRRCQQCWDQKWR